MSLVYGDNFATATTLESAYTFICLFEYIGLADVSNLILPATTLSEACYYGMFWDARVIDVLEAPVLPAATLAASCYKNMFRDTNFNKITCLATDKRANSCVTDWVRSIASNGTFVKAASMTGWTRGNSGIPYDWTVVDAS